MPIAVKVNQPQGRVAVAHEHRCQRTEVALTVAESNPNQAGGISYRCVQTAILVEVPESGVLDKVTAARIAEQDVSRCELTVARIQIHLCILHIRIRAWRARDDQVRQTIIVYVARCNVGCRAPKKAGVRRNHRASKRTRAVTE